MKTHGPHYLSCFANHIQPWLVEPNWARAVLAEMRQRNPTFLAMDDYGGGETPEQRERRLRAEIMQIDSNGVATIRVNGPMAKFDSSMGGANTVRTRQCVRLAAADPAVGAIMIVGDSPGGTCSGTMELAADVAAAGQQKPCYGYAEDMACSAFYWVLSQTKKIYANATAWVGSIGTVSVVEDSSKAAELAGIKVHVVSTGKLKGSFADGTPITEDQLSYLQGLIDDLNVHFLDAVAKGRGMTKKGVADLADGSIMIASKAAKAGLIDGVMSFDAALAELTKKAKPAPGKKADRARALIELEEAR